MFCVSVAVDVLLNSKHLLDVTFLDTVCVNIYYRYVPVQHTCLI